MTLHTSADAPINCIYWDELVDEDGFLALGRNRYHCSYVVYTDGTYYYAENGATGNLDFGGPNNLGGISGVSAYAVIQAAVTAIAPTGGKIMIKQGLYNITQRIDLSTCSHSLLIEGENNHNEIDAHGTRLSLANGVNDHLFYMLGNAIIYQTVTLRNMCLYGNGLNQTAGSLIYFDNVIRYYLENIFLYGAKVNGLTLENSEWGRLVNIIESHSLGDGFFIRSNGVQAVKCYSSFAGGRGWYIGGTSGTILIDCFADFATTHGFEFEDSEAAMFGGFSELNQQEGIYCHGTTNLAAFGTRVSNNSQTGAGAFAGVGLEGVTKCKFFGCRFIDTQGAATQAYGVLESAGADYNVFVGNEYSGNVTAQALFIGTHDIIHEKIGYITENKGAGEVIVAAATSVVVPHGCSYTPVAADIDVRLTNLPTNDIGDVWLSAIGTANFTINCRNVPGVATAIFSWAVRRI